MPMTLSTSLSKLNIDNAPGRITSAIYDNTYAPIILSSLLVRQSTDVGCSYFKDNMIGGYFLHHLISCSLALVVKFNNSLDTCRFHGEAEGASWRSSSYFWPPVFT